MQSRVAAVTSGSSSGSKNRPTTISEYVCSEIRDKILAGAYPLGSKLDQQSLAVQHEVSVIPVREALRQLEAEGLVRILPRRGAFVIELSPPEIKELFHLRAVLEGYATELAAPRLTASQLQGLHRITEQLEQATADGDIPALLELNRSFHFYIYEAAESPLLMSILSGLWDRATVYRRLYGKKPESHHRFLVEHLQVLRACESGDALASRQLMRDHILRFGRDVLSLIDEQSVHSENGSTPS
jgi:DNA-binding GntR family transcriptional regulator